MLHGLSSLTSEILAADLMNGAGTMLELVRIAARADDCELFLADLHGREILLGACIGPHRDLLTKRSRFESGDGIPGRAFAQGHPVTAQRLAPGDRFARDESQSPELSFASIPLAAPNKRIIGCLDLAWRDSDVPVEDVAEVLWKALSPLGNAICAAYWTYRQNIVEEVARSTSPPSDASLKALRDATEADAACLVMWSERDHKILRTDTFGSSPPRCPWLASPEASPCSSRSSESCFRLLALGAPDERTPEPCKQVSFDGTAVCCVPVVGHPDRTGRLLVGFRKRAPEDARRLLVPLQVMAEHIGTHLHEPDAATRTIAAACTLPPLDIRCFGHFEVSIGGDRLGASAFPRRDALTLLKLLVLRAGKQVHRERLIDWLWPSANEQSGLNRLHGVVHALRAVIEPYAAERRWTYLLSEGETYTFLPGESTSVDLISFQENLALARRDLKDATFAPHVTHYLEQAVELYRGDLYEDDQYCDWCDVERIALQRDFVEALASLARISLTLGEAKRAIDAFRRALTYDPSREDLHDELIRCLIRQRRHNEARDQVRECVRYLREEVGVEPGSETQRLYDTLLDPVRT